MQERRPIQEEVTPLSSVSGAEFLLFGVLRCTRYHCPHCNAVFKTTWGLWSVLLGCGESACVRCHRSFRDGSLEWSAMSLGNQLAFLLPFWVAGWLFAAVVVSSVLLYAKFGLGTNLNISLLLGFFVAPMIPWFTFRGFQIVQSMYRYAHREQIKTS